MFPLLRGGNQDSEVVLWLTQAGFQPHRSWSATPGSDSGARMVGGPGCRHPEAREGSAPVLVGGG